MKANDILRESVQFSVELLEMMKADVTPEQLDWNPLDTAHSVAAVSIHAALATDWQIHALFEGAPRALRPTGWTRRASASDCGTAPSICRTLTWVISP